MAKKSNEKSKIRSSTGARQVDASLHEPINVEAPPTIYGTKIKPELATASLNLAIEFVKQEQSLANKHLINHYITYAVILIVSTVYLTPRVVIPRNLTSPSVGRFLYQLLHFNKYPFATLFAIIAISFVGLFTAYSRITDTFFKSKIDDIARENGKVVFGIDLRSLAIKEKQTLSSVQVDNTYIIIYRETPIALISITENAALSQKESLVMSISSLGCRKVYQNSGIVEDLLDWAMLRTKTIGKEGNYGKSMKLLIDVYSFDSKKKQILKSKGFTLIKSAKLQESRLLGGLFGVDKEIWGIQFHFEQGKKD